MIRRDFIKAAAVSSWTLSHAAMVRVRRLSQPLRLGFIADLHHDVMHDGQARLDAFLKVMAADPPDAVIQLGDFAYPSPQNRQLIDTFNKAHPRPLHVIGNHDVDDGYTFAQVVKGWGMTGRYYSEDIAGLQLIVLDGNERPDNHRGGYPAHIGEKQRQWLQEQLASQDGPAIILSHQPLAGPSEVDNAAEVRRILKTAAERILLAVNGHTHIDALIHAGDVNHLHVNSASYYWVGGDHQHASYPAEVHEQFPWIRYTCPYRDSLFTTLTIKPDSGEIEVSGRNSTWVGKSPGELGCQLDPGLADGKQVVPRINFRQIARVAS